MVGLHSLIRGALAALALLVAFAAQASFPATTGQVGWTDDSGQHKGATKEIVCASLLAARRAGDPSWDWSLYTIHAQCVFEMKYKSNGARYMLVGHNLTEIVLPGSCPANATLSGNLCTCNAPAWKQEGNACVPFISEKDRLCQGFKTEALTSGPLLGLKPVNGLVCDESGLAGSYGGGCVVAVSGPTVTVTLPGQVGATAVEGAYTGAVCQGSAATPPATAASAPLSAASAPPVQANPCPNGQPGTVNGATVCVPYPSNANVSSSTPSTKETTNPDGTKERKESTQTTSCQSGVCSTTTTTVTTNINAGGTVTGTATTQQTATQGKGQFCAENPGSPQCSDGEDSSFGGSCVGGFVCKGDAVQCAVAREIHTQNCKWNDASSTEFARYQADKTRTGDQTADLPGSTTVSLAPGAFDTTDALGAPSSVGMADLNVQVWGRDLSLPFSNLNPYLAIMGNVLLACTFVLCARIVMRG